MKTEYTLHAVSRHFGKKTILQNVTYTFHPGTVYALLGASGSGKTTLLRILAGLEKTDAGNVSAIAERISFSFQDYRLFPTLTVRENAEAVLPERSVDKILAALDLISDADKRPAELSGGMKNRAGLARALSKQADFYLIDEPTAGQDEAHADAVMETIRKYTAGAAVVIATHDLARAEKYTDIRLTLRAGILEEEKK